MTNELDDLACRLDEKRAKHGIVKLVTPTPNQSKAEADEARIEAPTDAGSERDPRTTLVKPGEYLVGYVRYDVAHLFGSWRALLHFQIVEGADAGKLLLRAYPLQRGEFLARTSTLWQDYLRLTGRRPPSKGFNPLDIVEDCQIAAKVVTVHESRGEPGGPKEQPASVHYSKIDALLRIALGTPPLLAGHRARRPLRPPGGKTK